MKKIKSVVANSLVDDLKSIGLYAHAGVIEQAIHAKDKIKDILDDEGIDDEESDCDLDGDGDEDLEEVLEEEGVGDNESEEDEELPDNAVGLDEKTQYSPRQIKKLKAIANECLTSNTSTVSAKALLTAIANYEASR